MGRDDRRGDWLPIAKDILLAVSAVWDNLVELSRIKTDWN